MTNDMCAVCVCVCVCTVRCVCMMCVCVCAHDIGGVNKASATGLPSYNAMCMRQMAHFSPLWSQIRRGHKHSDRLCMMMCIMGKYMMRGEN